MPTDTLESLKYYGAHGCALFPIPAGSKTPTGIIDSFAHDWSRDPAQWQAWRDAHPNCNFGLVAGPSRLIIIDIDTHSTSREDAWSAWTELCVSWGLPGPLTPHVQSARGGWHVLFAVPPDIDAATLRQPDAIKKLINVRAGNGYVVAAGSYYDGSAKGEQSGHYLLMSDAPPHPAPAALIAHCTRAAASRTKSANVGTHELADIRALIEWMAERDAFTAYEDWLAAGMALKLEAGDEGFPLWELTFDDTVTPEVAASKWDSFASEPEPGVQTLATLLSRANQLGWRGNIRKSTAAMFGTVAEIAAAAGATLSSAVPSPTAPTGAIPLLDTQKTVAALGQPVLDNFLAGTKNAPSGIGVTDIQLPDTLHDHPLFDLLNESISRILAMAEGGSKTFRQSRVLQTLAVLHAVHGTVCEHLTQRIAALGGVLSPGSLDSAIKNFEGRVRVEQNTAAGFITDSKGNPAPDNSDNVHVFIRQRQIQLRYNVWKDQAEFADNDRGEFEQLTDHAFGDLLMDAENSQFNYHPSEGRFRRGLISAARKTLYDPLTERIDALAAAWDGQSRLATWLTFACGVPCDPYHQAVGRNIIGGLVRRARHPGCQQAETVIFISPLQGTGKSTLTKILALDDNWHTDSFKFGGRQQDMIPQLAGKWIVELSDLAGMHAAEVEDIKAFLSSTVDNYTKKYEAFATDHPRRCVFMGTSNDKRPLRDTSGNRRFLPVHVQGEVNLDWLRANVEQIIGEAATREAAGESFAIPREIWALANEHQEAARHMTPLEELCYEWFDRAPGSYFITSTDIARALKMAGQSTHARYAAFLDKMGWDNGNLVVPETGRKSRVWYRHKNRNLDECTRLEPVQSQVNGRVEMRVTRSHVVGAATPPPSSNAPPMPPTFGGPHHA